MKPTPEEIEKLVHRALGELPDRRAPRTLETRVLAEISRRAALPWWRQSFAHWPLAVRAGFFVLSAAVAAALLAGLFLALRSAGSPAVAGALWQRFAWLDALRSAGSGTAQAAGDVFGAIPQYWLYGTLAAIAALYAAIVGLGAAAYRAFATRA